MPVVALPLARERSSWRWRVLYIAATGGEAGVERALLKLRESAERFDADKVRHAVRRERQGGPVVAIGAPNMRIYDALLEETAFKAPQVDVVERTIALLISFNLSRAATEIAPRLDNVSHGGLCWKC